MQPKPGLLPATPPIVALALIVGSFLLGHWSQQAHDVQTKAQAPQQAHTDRHLRRRELRIDPKTDSIGSEHKGVAHRRVLNPLDTAALEQHMLHSTQLLEVRPPIEPAASGDDFVRVIPFQILSWLPRMVLFPAFVDPERCRAIIEYGGKQLEKSGLAYRPGEKEDQEGQDTRTSTGAFLSSENDPTGALAWVEERIAAAAQIPVSHGEPFNLLRYQNMQHYDAHLDAFDPKEYGPQSSQRIATALIYLSDVEEGGETVFKREGRGNGSRPITEWRNCDDGEGYKYRPRQGDMILFYDTHPDGAIDQHALHGGCPVKKGEKWVMTKWLRNQPMISDTAAELEAYAKAAKEEQGER